jgi:serine/threonine protein kinase
MNKFKVEASEKSFAKYQSEVVAMQKAGTIPQVIRIIDFFKSKANYYIVTEYFPGSCDLYDYMIRHRQKFCEDEARGLWRDLLEGIRSLHAMGIYHRDLKLQNIVYLPDERRAKVIDFGMATCFPNPEGVVGSPMFMSPQVLGSQKYSHKCDTWSLGIIFYCMIFRSSPYDDHNTPKAILEKMRVFRDNGLPYPPEAFISKGCREVIDACLQFEEKDRLEIGQILQLKFFQEVEIPERALEYY